MKIELPDDAHASVDLLAESRAHVKDMQAQFPEAKWEHKVIEPGDSASRPFPVVKGRVGRLTITIFPRDKVVAA